MSSLTVSSNTTDFTIMLQDPILLSSDVDYEAALTSLHTYNSCPNIVADDNNKLRYSTDKGLTWKVVSLATGAYELAEINSEIQRQMINNGDYRQNDGSNMFYINFTINKPTAKSILEINDANYVVDFNIDNSIAKMLGFDKNEFQYGIHESSNVIDIEAVNAMLVHCNFVTGSSIDGINSQVLYSFSPKVSPGYKIIEIPSPQLFFHPVVKQSKIERVHIWITDQNKKKVDLRGEKITLSIQVRECKNNAKLLKLLLDKK